MLVPFEIQTAHRQQNALVPQDPTLPGSVDDERPQNTYRVFEVLLRILSSAKYRIYCIELSPSKNVLPCTVQIWGHIKEDGHSLTIKKQEPQSKELECLGHQAWSQHTWDGSSKKLAVPKKNYSRMKLVLRCAGSFGPASYDEAFDEILLHGSSIGTGLKPECIYHDGNSDIPLFDASSDVYYKRPSVENSGTKLTIFEIALSQVLSSQHMRDNMLQTVFNDEELKLLTLDLPSSHRAFIVTARIKVMMFTFGASFTYHLLSQDFFGMATCVEVAECLTLLITKECGTEFAFEGITALVSETLDNIALFSLTNDSSGCDAVFKSCMHVLCTLYQVNTEDSSNLGVIQATASGPITAALRKVLEATIVLEWAWKPTKNSVSIRGDVGTTVHRDLYKFFRLLLQQSHTRVLLAQIMIPREDKNTSLQLEHGLLRMYVVWLDCTCTASYDLRPILVHFSKFCLRIATDTQKSATSRLLARHCYSAAIMNSENSKYLILNKKPIQVSHFPLYVVAPFSSEELQVFTIRLRRVDEEVNGIYQYTFTAESMNHCDLSSIEAIEVLEKKNIRFKGSIVHRGVETLNAEKRGTRSSSATPKKTSPTDKVIELLIQDQESYKSSELTDAIESSRAMMYSRSNGSQEGVDIGKDGADTNISPLKPNMSTEQRKKKENCCLQ